MKYRAIAVSMCFVGNSRYDGNKTENIDVLNFLKKLKENNIAIHFICPEQLGGLSTPRVPSEIKDGRVVNKKGIDVTDNFKKGADEILEILKFLNIKAALLKQRSPSCGKGKIYDGSFTGKLIDGDGVTAKCLKSNGIKVFTEEELDKILIFKDYFIIE
ncbi:DUF523 domain-containing protein [Anaerosphaera multitolerans]|uniref:DUF523 domain-containing protein n=1 Tax=Anaerosphaera multitolerans TaxID=2487351 RepID=A0A437S6A4_9FIRM|nr:DUF523 domain-containing protein [Anaerosphaera multitolerans]RVU54549.1 DUF523 domain-containing protein [Anaerosphaera multitolerans]